jgi:RNA polymerase subunit RPABC4/transcription elongation factor Spt4
VVPFGKKDICWECLDKLQVEPIVCPNCNGTITADDFVGVRLGRIGRKQILDMDNDMAATVCPHCKIIFMDPFQYEIILGIKRDMI